MRSGRTPTLRYPVTPLRFSLAPSLRYASPLQRQQTRKVAAGRGGWLLLGAGEAELAKADKERAREFKDYDQKKLDGRIDQINKAWEAKYGKKFDLSDKDTVFDSRFAMAQGEVADPALALANWPVAATGNEAVTASNKEAADRDTKQQDREASKEKLEKGRNVAVIRFPAAYGFNAINVSMIHQLPAFYRVDISNSRTGEQIYNDLLNHLTWIGEHVDQWPADVNDAYRMVAYHAVAAVEGVDVPSGKAG